MNCYPYSRIFYLFLFLGMVAILSVCSRGYSHCDTMDGPVIRSAQKALKTGNVNYVLVWVKKDDEQKITKAFQKTLKARNENTKKKNSAETRFFETLVRIHRQGEGESYRGIKPAGTDLGPVIPLGDKSIQAGSTKDTEKFLLHAIQSGLENRFQDLMNKKNYSVDDLDAGREYIHAYVRYLHYIEGIYQSASGEIEVPSGPSEKSGKTDLHHH